MCSLGFFSLYDHVIGEDSLFLPSLIAFLISFSCLTAPTLALSTLLIGSDESGHHFLVSDLRGTAFNLSTAEYNVQHWYFVNAIYHLMLRKFLSIPSLVSAFIVKKCWILSNAFHCIC